MGGTGTKNTYFATGGAVTVPGQVNPVFNISPVVNGTAITSTDGINFNLEKGFTYICTATVVDLAPYVSIQFRDNTTSTTFGQLSTKPAVLSTAVTITGHLIVATPTAISVVILSNTPPPAITTTAAITTTTTAAITTTANTTTTTTTAAGVTATATTPVPVVPPVCQISIVAI